MMKRCRALAAGLGLSFVFALPLPSALAAGKAKPTAKATPQSKPEEAPQGQGERLMLLSSTGPKKQTVEKREFDALKHANYEVLSQEKSENPTSDADFASLGKELGVKVFIAGATSMSQHGWELKGSLRSGVDGSVVSEFSFKAGWLPGLLKQIDKELVPAVQKALEKVKASEDQVQEIELGNEQKAAPPPVAAKPAEEPESTERPSPFYAGLHAGVVVRNWTPKDSLFGQVLGQKNAGMASGRLTLGVYPAAFATGGILSNLGLIGSLETSVAAKTKNATGGTSSMTHHDYWGALHYRIPAGEHQLGLSAGLGWQSMDIDLPPSLYVPDVKYNYVRLALDSTFNFGDFSLSLDAGYRAVSKLGNSLGQVAHVDWFPKAEATGMELGIGLGYALTDSLSLELDSDYRRYGFDFHRKPADQMNLQPVAGGPVPIAGGATDTYFGGWLGIVYHIPAHK